MKRYRRHLLIGCTAVAVSCAIGVMGQGKADIRSLGLPSNIVKGISNVQLDDLDKQILDMAISKDKKYDPELKRATYTKPALELVSHPKWKSVSKDIKQEIIDGKCRWQNGHTAHNDDFVCRVCRDDINYLPCVVSERTVFRWVASRPVRPEMEYVALPDTLKKGLTTAEAE